MTKLADRLEQAGAHLGEELYVWGDDYYWGRGGVYAVRVAHDDYVALGDPRFFCWSPQGRFALDTLEEVEAFLAGHPDESKRVVVVDREEEIAR